MSLVPSYTSPPAVNWYSAYWADDKRNYSHPNDPTVEVLGIRSLDGNPRKTMYLTSATKPHYSLHDSDFNGRACWVVDAVTDWVYSEALADQGQDMTIVVVMKAGSPTTNQKFVSTGLAAQAPIVIGTIAGQTTSDKRGLILSGSNNSRFTRTRWPDSAFLLRSRVKRTATASATIAVNGDTHFSVSAPTGFNNTVLTTRTVLGSSAAGQTMVGKYAFIGLFIGDPTTDPEWSNFLSWVQSSYGFDPTATLATTNPPPIDWRSAWWAEDYDGSSTWVNRIGTDGKDFVAVGGGSTIPTKVTNVVNGKSVVRFDGTDDYMKATGVSLAPPLSTIIVARKRSAVSGSQTWIGSDNSETRVPGANSTQWIGRNATANSQAYGSVLPTDWSMIRIYQTGTGSDVLAVNETVLTSAWNTGSSTITDAYLATTVSLGAFADLDIAFVGLFYGDIATQCSYWTDFKTWVSNTYGITVA